MRGTVKTLARKSGFLTERRGEDAELPFGRRYAFQSRLSLGHGPPESLWNQGL